MLGAGESERRGRVLRARRRHSEQHRHGRFDGASIIGTACPHAGPHAPNGPDHDPFPRKGLKPTRADTTSGGFGSRKPGPQDTGVIRLHGRAIKDVEHMDSPVSPSEHDIFESELRVAATHQTLPQPIWQS